VASVVFVQRFALGMGMKKTVAVMVRYSNKHHILIVLLTVLSKCIIFPGKDVSSTSAHELLFHYLYK
jgi:hypothetical protein